MPRITPWAPVLTPRRWETSTTMASPTWWWPTLDYSALAWALVGLQKAGYRFVAWGTNHKENGGKPKPVLTNDAPPDQAKELAKRCRDLGLEPVMMFGPAPEDLQALKQRVRQAAAARLG